jgi:hypothetical protein
MDGLDRVIAYLTRDRSGQVWKGKSQDDARVAMARRNGSLLAGTRWFRTGVRGRFLLGCRDSL